MQSATQTKKWQMSWKKNWTPSLRITEELIVNQNSFRVWVFCILQTFVKQDKQIPTSTFSSTKFTER